MKSLPILRCLALVLVAPAATKAQTLLNYYSFDTATLATTGASINGAFEAGGIASTYSETLFPLGTPPTVDAAGRFGQAANFIGGSGLDTAINWGSGSATLGASFSISFWMKTPDVTASIQTYVLQTGASSGAPQNAVLFGYSPGQVQLYSTTGPNPQAVSGITLPTSLNNTWFNIAYTYDGSSFVGYLNGVQQFSHTSSLNLAASGGLSIGSARNGAAPVPGSIDDLAIWAGALSSSQVLGLQSGPVLAVPEPSTYAAIAGAGALALAAWRRRRPAASV
jgi:hypothetical protein